MKEQIKKIVLGALLGFITPLVVAFYLWAAYVVIFSPADTQNGNDLSPLGIDSPLAP